jgi:serine/threonine-protein kinase
MTAIARSPGDRYPTAKDFGRAIGQAAAAAWGPDWFGRVEAQVMDPTLFPDASRATATSGPASGRQQPTVRVRSSRARYEAPSLVDVVYEDLVPVRHLVPPASKPVALAVASVILVALTLFVAFLVDGPRGTLPGGAPTVAGVDISNGAVPRIDLTKPVEVRFQGVPAAGGTEVQLALSRLPLVTSDTEPLVPLGGRLFGASLDIGPRRYLIAGTVTAELRLRGNDKTVDRFRFRVQPTHNPLLTVPGVSAVVLLPLVLAYGWTLLRRAARGRALIRWELAKMAGVGAAFGLLTVVFGWMAGAGEPDFRTVLACLTGGAAGVASVQAVAGAVAARQSGNTPAP